MGYRTVALSSSAAKKDFAFELGATDYVDGSTQDTVEELQKIGGASLVVVTAPNPKIMEPLTRACGPRGKVLILARKFFSPFSFPLLLSVRFGFSKPPGGGFLTPDACHFWYLSPSKLDSAQGLDERQTEEGESIIQARGFGLD